MITTNTDGTELLPGALSMVAPTFSGDPNGTLPKVDNALPANTYSTLPIITTNALSTPPTTPVAPTFSGDPSGALNVLATQTSELPNANLTTGATTGATTGVVNPNLTQAGTSILGPTASVVGNTMYTSDGRIITNPILADYRQYGLTAPRGTPAVSPVSRPGALNLFGSGNFVDQSRRESQYSGASTTPRLLPAHAFANLIPAPKDPNPYAAFGTGQDVNKAYLTQSGAIVLPTGQIIKNPTAADYAQYELGISSPFAKGSLKKDESNVINTLKIASTNALNFVNQQIKDQGLSKKDADQLRQSVTSEWNSRIQNYSRTANLPGSQGYNGFYTLTPEQYIEKIPEDKRSLRPTAEQIFNALPEADRTNTSLENVQTWLNNNPDYKIELTPELVQNAASAGTVNLGTKLIGWDYDKLAVTDPEQLKALNAAGNRYSMGLNMLNDWGLLQGSRQGKTRTGYTIKTGAALAEAVADGTITSKELARYAPHMTPRGLQQLTDFAKDMMALRGDTDITLKDLRRITPGGTKPELVDPENGIYAVSAVKYKKGNHYILAQKTGDDQYRVVGGTRTFTPTDGGGFWNWAPRIAGLALAIFAPQLGPAIGGAITGAGAAGAGLLESVIGNAILGGITSGISGGDIGTGILTGGIGGGVGNLTSGALNGINIAGLPINSGIINAISGTASGLATSPLTGADPGAILTGGLLNVGGNILNPAISSGVQSAFPNLSPGVTNAISSGLTAGALSPLTGTDPRVLAGGTLANVGTQYVAPYFQGALKNIFGRNPLQRTTTNRAAGGLIRAR
jgi:hypothetical protein